MARPSISFFLRVFLVLLLPALVSCDDAAIERAFDDFVSATQVGDWATVYGSLTEATAAKVDSIVTEAIRGVPSLAHLEEDDPAVRFAAVADNVEELFNMFELSSYEIIETIGEGDRATVTITAVRNRTSGIEFVRLYRQNGAWKVDL